MEISGSREEIYRPSVVNEEVVATVRQDDDGITLVITPISDHSREWKVTFTLEEALEIRNGLSDLIRKQTVIA